MNEQNNQEADHQQSMIENSVAAESLADLQLTASQENEIAAGMGPYVGEIRLFGRY
ncbi:MAG: hypothetical protein ACKVZH_17165 [Blastocatellia bacterium]